MSETEQNEGALRELHSNSPQDGRAVNYHFENGVSGNLTLLSGDPLDEGEIYLLTGTEQNRRIEILEMARNGPHQEEARSSYRFRVV